MVRRVLCAVAAILLLSVPMARAEYFDNLVRLHVLAESDADADQAFKLRVRDGVLTYAQELLKDCQAADDAFDIGQGITNKVLA